MNNLDYQVVIWLNDLAGKSDFLNALLFGLNKISLVLFGLVLVFYFFKNRKIFWTGLFSTILARGVLTELIRFLIPRPRPFIALENVKKLVKQNPLEPSFPSGHAALMFAIAFTVSLFNKKIGGILIVVALILSLIRVYAGVHYPSDILGGIIVAGTSVYLAQKFIRRRTDRETNG